MKKLIIFSIMLISIGANAQGYVTSIPDWYSNPPKSARKHYGAGVGTSKAADIAESKALLDAKICIAEQAGRVIIKHKKSRAKQNQEELLQEKITEAQLSDVRVIKKATMLDGNNYTIFILVEMKKRK